VNKHTPESQLDEPYFGQYKCDADNMEMATATIDLDAIPVYA
jgi:hypothetical protein